MLSIAIFSLICTNFHSYSAIALGILINLSTGCVLVEEVNWVLYAYDVHMSQKHILNSNAKHTHYSKLLVEMLPQMVRGCLSRLLEVGVGVKRLQVAD